MTSPTTQDAVSAARQAEKDANQVYLDHFETCSAEPCWSCSRLATEADSAGKRARFLEARASGGSVWE